MLILKNTIILLILLNKITSNKCFTGCQRCVSNKCTICDLSQYYLKNGECFLRVEDDEDFNDELDSNENYENCLDIDFNNKCKRCSKYYFLNENNFKCEEIEKKKRISNCLEAEEKKCNKCRTGYYLENNSCPKFTNDNKIDNCISAIKIDSFIFCEICKKGYIPSLDSSKCVKTDIKNCLYFSYLDCTSCLKDQFLINKNNYTTKLIGDKDSLFTILIQSFSLKKKITLFPVCYPKNVENCLILEDTDNCKICNEFHYLKKINGKNVCISTPRLNGIKNCLYSQFVNGVEHCILCETEFLLQQTKCISYEKIEFCTSHFWSENHDAILCKTCFFNYILNKDNKSCLKISIIDNCKTYELFNDNSLCNKCEDNFFLSSSKNLCIEKINNCEDHVCICEECEFDFCKCDQYCKKTTVSCKKCENLYFLNNLECEKGKIDKCKVYTNLTVCQECESGYYLENNLCNYGSIDYCDEYLNKNNCEICKHSFIPVKQIIDCKTNELFSEDIILPLYSNCQDYSFYEDNKIFLDCNSCKEGFFPLKILDSYYCNSIPIVKLYNNDPTIEINEIEFCQYYDIDFNCEKCEENYFLDYGVCKENCDPKLYLIKISRDTQSDNLIITRECIDTIPIDNCKKAILLQNVVPNTESYICEECAENYFIQTDFQQTYNLEDEEVTNYLNFQLFTISGKFCFTIENYQKIENCLIPSPPPDTSPPSVSSVETQTCFYCEIGFKPSGNLCIENPSAIEFYEDFYKVRFPRYIQDFLFIFKCRDGKMSVVDNIELVSSCEDHILSTDGDYLENCAVYFRATGIFYCLICLPGFKPSNPNIIPDVCEEIDHCDLDLPEEDLWFNGCSKCKINFAFKMDNQKIVNYCVPSNDLNCFAVNSNGDCVFCNEGYFLINNICERLQYNDCENNKTDLGNITYLTLNKYKVPISVIKNRTKFNGCKKCLNGKLSVKTPLDLTACEKSDYLSNENNFIPNCDFMNLNSLEELICKKCNTNHSLSHDSKTCINTNGKNCLRVDNNLKCIECNKEYMLENNNCVKSILNCKEIINGNCFKCNEGYSVVNLKNNVKKCFKNKDDCLEGEFSVISGINYFECTKCSGFKVMEINDDNYFLRCDLFLKEEDNCFEYDNNKLLSESTFECLNCDYRHFYKNLELNECILRENKDDNCHTFDECADQCAGGCACGNCDNLIDIDGCNGNFFFDYLELKSCIKSPIIGCKKFIDEDFCSECLPNYYLDNRKCLYLKQEDMIENCEIYEFVEKLFFCLKCYNYPDQDDFYYLSDNECKISKAKNCKLNLNQEQCLTCYSSYYVQKNETDNIYSCLKNPTFCEYYTEYELEQNLNPEITSGHCKKCNSADYILDNSNRNGICSEEKYEKIQNCETHEKISDKITCQKCLQDFALKNNTCEPIFQISNTNLKLCNNFFYDINFKIGEELAKCSLCDLGYFLKEEECVSCSVLNLNFCAICVEREKGGECLFCGFGYYMNDLGFCVVNDFS